MCIDNTAINHLHSLVLWLQVDSEQCLVEVLAVNSAFALRAPLTVVLGHGVVTKLVGQER